MGIGIASGQLGYAQLAPQSALRGVAAAVGRSRRSALRFVMHPTFIEHEMKNQGSIARCNGSRKRLKSWQPGDPDCIDMARGLTG
jgi:hypothetical protein